MASATSSDVCVGTLEELGGSSRHTVSLRSDSLAKYHSLVLYRTEPVPGTIVEMTTWHAMEAECPHLGADMSMAQLEIEDDGVVAICPWHNYDFNLRTGESSTGLKTCVYKTSERAGQLWVGTRPDASDWKVLSVRPVSERFAEAAAELPLPPSVDDAPKTLTGWGALVLSTADPYLKVSLTRHAVSLFRSGSLTLIGSTPPPDEPPRTNKVVDPGKVGARGKGGSVASRVKLLHALANIEQWAIDLAWDIVVRFAQTGSGKGKMPLAFFSDFCKVAEDEAKHFTLLRESLQRLGSDWGAYPTHNGLWQSARDTAHSLVSRLCIIHLVHEARGLDVNPTQIKRVQAAGDMETADVLSVIHADEITHVSAGHRWLLHCCRLDGRDPVDVFRSEVKEHFYGKLKPPFNYEGEPEEGWPNAVVLRGRVACNDVLTMTVNPWPVGRGQFSSRSKPAADDVHFHPRELSGAQHRLSSWHSSSTSPPRLVARRSAAVMERLSSTDSLFGPGDSSFEAGLAAMELPDAMSTSVARPVPTGRPSASRTLSQARKRRRVADVGPGFEGPVMRIDGGDSDDEDSDGGCGDPKQATGGEGGSDGSQEEYPHELYQEAQYEPVKFGEFGRYMANKRKKLKVQEAALRDKDAEKDSRPQIFKNLVIHINGHSGAVSQAQLRQLIVLHGGTYMAYLDHKSVITHIIATSLTPKKREEFRKYKIARPEWIIESIAAGRLLRWSDFGLMTQADAGVKGVVGEAVSGAPTTQKTLGSMALNQTAKAGPGPRTSEARSKMGGEAKKRDRRARVSFANEPLFRPQTPEVEDAPPPRPRTPRTPKSPGGIGTDAENPEYMPTSRTAQHDARLNDQEWIAAHTAIAPDFLEGYYQQSRLHHLSTWRSELLERVGKLLAEKKAKQAAAAGGMQKKLRGDAKDGRTIMHVDFDCFFTTASLLSRPDLKGKPVCVCHAKGGGEKSTSEIASCSYEARAFGVKNGMALGRARELCPDIKTVDYNFPLYVEISDKFYNILIGHADDLQAVSVDECTIDVSNQCATASEVEGGAEDAALTLAESIRQEIFDATKCAASIGISHNILLARLALRKAKPDGAFHLLPSQVDEHLAGLDIGDLPGVGWVQSKKIEESLKTRRVGDIRNMPLQRVQDALGDNWGRTVQQYAKGIDARELKSGQPRKSVSTEVNYGIRFAPAPDGIAEAKDFMTRLSEELGRRLRELKLRGRHLTLHVMRRAVDADVNTWKFLGHGECDNVSRVAKIAGPRDTATDDGDIIGETAWRLLDALEIPPEELRGIGLQVQKLEVGDAAGGQSLLHFQPVQGSDKVDSNKTAREPRKRISNIQDTLDLPRLDDAAAPAPFTQIQLPPMSQVDADVLASLPPDVQAQIKRAIVTPARDAKAPVAITLPSSSQLDPRILAELPTDIRKELEAHYRKLAPAEPPKPPKEGSRPAPARATIPKMFVAAKPGAMTRKRKKEVDLKQQLLAAGTQGLKAVPVEAIMRPALILDPVKVTDLQLGALDIDVSFFRSLKNRQLELDVLSDACHRKPDVLKAIEQSHYARAQVRKNVPGSKAVALKPTLRLEVPAVPSIRRMTTTEEVCDLLDRWIETNGDDPPDEGDVERFSTFLLDTVDRKRGHGQDFEKAYNIVDWWGIALDANQQSMSPATEAGWRTAFADIRRHLNAVMFADHRSVLYPDL